jgi:hypothetical protein
MNTTILGEIRTLVEELQATAGNNDISRKVEIGERLSTYNWFLAEEIGNIHSDANTAEYRYKTDLVRRVNALDGPQGSKESRAKEELSGLHKDMVDKQNLLKRLTLLFQQTNVVIEQNRQTVSYLKKER